MGRKPLNLRGHEYHFLTLEEPTEKRDRRGCVVWRCRCRCGGMKETSLNQLRKHNVTSCGCRHRVRRGSRLTEAEKREMIRLRRGGETQESIAAVFLVTRQRVSQILKQELQHG